jgi:threonine dehydrogenase-like Zn-dependent dehydrogenase
MRVEEVDAPRVGSADILLKVAYCGVCGSDIPRIIKDAAHYYPIILGHEFSGVIVDVAGGLNPDLKGRKSVCAPLMPDFSDPQCAKGNYSLCKNYDFIGSNKQGGFAEYVAMPARNAIIVDDSLDLLSASFLEPLTVALHAINIMAYFELIIRKELTLKGSWLNYSAPFPGWEWEYGVAMLTKQQIDTKALMGSTLPLSQADRLPALLSETGGLKRKIVLDCSA